MTPPFNERPPGKVGVGQSHAVESGQKGIFLVKVRKLEILEEFLFADSYGTRRPYSGFGAMF